MRADSTVAHWDLMVLMNHLAEEVEETPKSIEQPKLALQGDTTDDANDDTVVKHSFSSYQGNRSGARRWAWLFQSSFYTLTNRTVLSSPPYFH
ncbi:hypothetical protein [uncultured Microbulbifer sp.]|uniref:hypothetical protein n=1 Tax=uncultured Microbulbifer sp. TaxID=348147 RepID=UPI002635F420|nr:hypothetical protein [uncultured Microbulbifer sp.]